MTYPTINDPHEEPSPHTDNNRARPEPLFNSRDDITNLTPEQADLVLELARQNLADQLYTQNEHHHLLDDCGDYLYASTTIWSVLFNHYWENDGDPDIFTQVVKDFLTFGLIPELACDGDIRFSLIEENLREELLEYQQVADIHNDNL